MIDAIQVSTSALRAQQQQIDLISNNLANMQTPAFKRARVAFAALSGAPPVAGDELARAAEPGRGSEMQWLSMVAEQGAIRATGRPLDVAIDGQGFFEVRTADQQLAYTRAGQLRIDADGFLATMDGARLSADIAVPPEANDIEIRPNGEVIVGFTDRVEREVVGQLLLSSFPAAEQMRASPGNTWIQTAASGEPVTGVPGEAGLGALTAGALEQSNVNVIEEMSNLVMAQRAYQLNARILQASDQILETINNLRR